MDRLPVFKALGDNSRYAIYLELARSPVPLSTAEIADTLDLHPNTVRPHLERMRDVGLLDVETDNRGAVGRPQHRYSLAADAPSLGLEPSSLRLLARLLAGVAAAAGADAEQAAQLGRPQGKAAALSRAKGRSCVQALTDELADLGFDPAVADDGPTTTIAFTHCPFRELAEAFPDLVFHLHRGIVEGFVEQAGGADVEEFATLADRDPCRVDLVAR
ncbi:MAG: helix-turn-helix domain-containing protein [Actinobacteria bacterium]|nr:helix-turn-helix domain-containing protein [Actinomycetota bacterium]